MEQRKTLSARIVHDDSRLGPLPDAAKVIGEAILRKVCVTATYNRTAIVLAPHILYTKHDELFVDGVVLERDGAAPRELKLGTFKLSGLSAVESTTRLFVAQALFDPADPKYSGTTIRAVKA